MSKTKINLDQHQYRWVFTQVKSVFASVGERSAHVESFSVSPFSHSAFVTVLCVKYLLPSGLKGASDIKC